MIAHCGEAADVICDPCGSYGLEHDNGWRQGECCTKRRMFAQHIVCCCVAAVSLHVKAEVRWYPGIEYGVDPSEIITDALLDSFHLDASRAYTYSYSAMDS